MNYETVHLGFDNTIDLLLKVDGVVADIVASTKITVTFGSTVISSETSASAFDWDDGSGMLYLKLGGESIPVGSYDVVLTLYDSVNTDGIRWNTFKCKVE